jgi:hypothetical protein
LVPLGHAIPTLDFDARDSEWRDEIGVDYPFPQPVPVDACGLTYTALWKEYNYDMATHSTRRSCGAQGASERLSVQVTAGCEDLGSNRPKGWTETQLLLPVMPEAARCKDQM